MAFVGTHERSLDDKGRLVLPARFRSHFSGVVYLSPGDGCISLWPSERFDLMVASVEEKIRSGELEPNVRRGVSSGSVEVSPDAQGRVMLPERLRAFARLEHEVVVCGAIDRIEIFKGPSSVLYGSDAIGGTVNAITGSGPSGSSVSCHPKKGSASSCNKVVAPNIAVRVCGARPGRLRRRKTRLISSANNST